MQIKHTKNYIPDYPRPRLTRKQWTSLNGEWRFAEGKRSSFADCERTINVPFAPECKLSGINKLIDDGYVTYAKKINLVKRGRVLLHFDGVDYKTSLFVNGTFVAENVGAYHRFTADITDYVADGENEILLQVYDSMDRTQVRGKQRWENKVYACFYVQTTGIWKSVWLEQVPDAYVADLQIATYGNRADFAVSTVGAAGSELTVAVSRGDFSAATSAVIGGGVTHLSLTVDSPDMWSADSPDLYDVEVFIKTDGRITDTVGSYFGFRDVEARDRRILVNGKTEYLKMLLVQGYWIDGHLTPSCEREISNDVIAIKQMGFNGARMHQKIEDDRFYYYCDVLGLYVWCEMPNMYTYTKQSAAAFAAEWRKVVEQHKSFPSIIAWVPFNESWGLNDDEMVDNKEIQAFVNDVCQYTRSVDARFVISNDGWEHTVSDLLTIHQYEQNADRFYGNYSFQQTTEGSPLNSRKPYCKGYKYGGQPILFTEFGGCSFKRDLTADAWGYGDAAENELEFAERLNGLISAIENMDFCSGWCYTQFTDVQQEVNGLLTEDRRFKLPAQTVNNIVRKKQL